LLDGVRLFDQAHHRRDDPSTRCADRVEQSRDQRHRVVGEPLGRGGGRALRETIAGFLS